MKKIIVLFLIVLLIPLELPIDAKADIEYYALNHDILKEESYYDPVWHVVPGINGLRVDKENSLRLMGDKIDESKIIYYDELISTRIEDIQYGPIYKGNHKKRMVSIIINCAWGNDIAVKMLDTLGDTRVNFFIEGKFALNNKDLVKKMSEKHLIGNHSYSHKDFSKMTYEECLLDIKKTNDILQEIIGKEIKYFSPPSGSYGDNALKASEKLNMRFVLFNVDTIDWQNPSVSITINRVLSKVENGAIILMHPKENTLVALPKIIEEIEKRELLIGTLDELLSPIYL